MATFTLVFVALVVLAYVVVALRKPSAAVEGLKAGGMSLVGVIPVMLAGFALAGLFQALIPEGFFIKWLGGAKGVKGVFLATLLGAVTPGPIVVPLAVVLGLAKGGAGAGSMVAYLVAWDVMPVRKLPLTLTLLGDWKFVLMKFGIGLPITILAGLLANAVSMNVRFFKS